jgi:hypothetical protein
MSDYMIEYQDGTGDVICIYDDDDMVLAYESARDEMNGQLRLIVKAGEAMEQPAKEERVVELNPELVEKTIMELAEGEPEEIDQEDNILESKEYGVTMKYFKQLVQKELIKNCEKLFEKMNMDKEVEQTDALD